MTLYLCPTPLGNLEDITYRVLRVLKEADIIAAEDTRHTKKLLNHFNIHTHLTSYHEHNKHNKTETIINYLLSGKVVALVSDAGTPGIADPGEELIKEAIKSDIAVISLPGPVAAVTALVGSGLPTQPFAFYGFPPAKGGERKDFLKHILAEDKTVVMYEAPHRLNKTLAQLCDAAPSRQVVVAREITKIHEQYYRATLAEALKYFEENLPRGEITLILAPASKEPIPLEHAIEAARQLIHDGISLSQAVREAAKATGVSRNKLYEKMIEKE